MSSVSKQKRLAKKAAKTNSKTGSPASTNGSNTPKDSPRSPPTAADNLSVTTLKLDDKDRASTGVLTSLPMSRDLKIESYSLSSHGRVLIENTTIELNFG